MDDEAIGLLLRWLSIEEGKVTDVDNESISVFKFKNWDHVKERCGRYGWEVVEFPEVSEELNSIIEYSSMDLLLDQ